MKTLKKVIIFITGICLLIACSKSDSFLDDKSFGNVFKNGKAQPVMVTLPFEARLVGTYVGFYSPGDEEYTCEEPFYCRVIVDAAGNATHMGKISAHFDFCACGPDDENIPGQDGKYGPTNVNFIAANGDILFLNCGGSVVVGRLPDHPEDVNSYWRDPFVIIGGTGRFAGATGGGMTDDYNRDSFPANSFHHWKGKITLLK